MALHAVRVTSVFALSYLIFSRRSAFVLSAVHFRPESFACATICVQVLGVFFKGLLDFADVPLDGLDAVLFRIWLVVLVYSVDDFLQC